MGGACTGAVIAARCSSYLAAARARGILAAMRRPLTPRRALRFAALSVLASLALVALGAAVGCGPNTVEIWVCLNPVTGKPDGKIYDSNNYANGEPDPCHCYDACGPALTCPEVVDAGPLPPGCDAGDGG